MHKDTINIDITPNDQISSEQSIDLSAQRDEHSIQNGTRSKEIGSGIKKAKKIPMNPSRLEYSWWSTHPTEMIVIAFILFTITIITVGVMIVCLTQLVPPAKTCAFVLKTLVRNSLSNDSRPHSVAIGDFNNDGLLDIVVPNSGMNNIGVFLRHTNGTFTNQVTYSTGYESVPYAVAVTDFNGDQQPDIAVANYGGHNIGIFLGIGNGTFEPQITFSTESSRPRSIAIGDLNNDTRPDIVVVNYATNDIGVFLQDTNGSFANQITFSTGYDSDPYSLVVGDLNNDQKFDIAVANYGTDNVGVLFGYGNGTFQTQIIFTTGIGCHPSSIAIDNLSKDTYLDIAVACSGTDNVGVLLGYGNDTFTMLNKYAMGKNSLPRSVVIADLDNDNRLDIAVANYGNDSVAVLLGDGNGSFSVQNQAFFTSFNFNPYSIATADFNSDNRSDIAVVNYDFNHVDIILNYKNYSFHDQTTYTTDGDSYPLSVVTGDLNNDNHSEIIIANYRDSRMEIFSRYRNDTFSLSDSFSTGWSSGPSSIAVGDFNNDNNLDLVYGMHLTSMIGVYLGNGDGTFLTAIVSPTASNSYPIAIVVGNFNNDNKLDAAVANFGTNSLGVFLGNGDGSFSIQIIYPVGSDAKPHSIATGDFNSDSRLDIVVANMGTYNVIIFFQHVDGLFQNAIIYATGYDSRPSAIVVGDFNDDSRTDIAVAKYETNTISIILGYGNGTFSNQIITVTGSGFSSSPCSITIGDFNSDNRLDVAVANYLANYVSIFIGYGNGSLSSPTIHSTGSGSKPWSVAVADLNDDTHLDIVVMDYGTGDVEIFTGYGNGNFTTQQTVTATIASNPTSVAVGDFNGDGRLDITVANYWSNNVGIFLGFGDGTFSSQTVYDTGEKSGPSSMTVGDFNNDSRLDIVVTNSLADNIGVLLGYGNGTFSKQTNFSTGYSSQPCGVAVGDFNNDHQLDVAVTNMKASNIGIFLGYVDGTFANQVGYSTDSDSQPTSIAIGDLNNDNGLDIVVTNSNEVCSIEVLLGYGNGIFSSRSTYSFTRGSYPLNAVIGELNNDGRLDIVVALPNDFSIVVFLGNGDGTFSRSLTYLTGSQSLPYACALGDVNNDNQLDVVVSDRRNSDIVVLLGDGHGGFSNKSSYSTGSNSFPQSVAFGDFNNDGVLDIVVANYDNDTIGVFLGFTYINGVRESICSTGSSSHPRAVALADFNRDTQLDIAMTNYGLDNVKILSEDMNKTFSMQIMLSTGDLSLPTSVAVGDFNDDSKLDITVANYGTGNIGIFYGYENCSFKSQAAFSHTSNFIPQSVGIGDFNNDKRVDIVVADSGTESVLILLSYDSGTFENETVHSTGADSSPQSVAVGDLNNDGWLDFVVSNSGLDNIGVFLGMGNGTFLNQTTYSTGIGSSPQCIAIADLNNDSHLDMVACRSSKEIIGIFIGVGNGTFSNQTTYSTGGLFGSSAAALGNFNNDSWLDIVVVNYWSSSIGFFFGTVDGIVSSVTTYSTGDYSGPYSVAVGDFNNDNRLDIVVANAEKGNLGIFIGYGDGTFSFVISYPLGILSGPRSVVVGDFNNDSRLDVAVANSHSDDISVLFGYGNGSFSKPIPYSTGSDSSPFYLATGDFNNDNQLDIAVANYLSNSFSVLLGCANGTFFSPLNYLIADGSRPNAIAFGDFNNDSRLDIIVTGAYTDHVHVFFGYVSEKFLFAPSFSTGYLSRPTSVAVGDFDHDTRLDVVVANSGMGNIMVLSGSGYGTFVGNTSYATGNDSHPRWVAVGDLNNDSRLDIVVANSGTSNIGIFLNDGSGTFSSQLTYSTGIDSQPYSVAVLDFDNDTRLDIAVANYGSSSVIVFFGDGNGNFIITNQSTYYTGFGSHPFALTVGDINNDNYTDIVVTNDGYGSVDAIMKEC